MHRLPKIAIDTVRTKGQVQEARSKDKIIYVCADDTASDDSMKRLEELGLDQKATWKTGTSTLMPGPRESSQFGT
ncbi:hypothetical protein N7495_008226 [Penicillium taxi]|uniref:uncharacterized protein n=1 Tax=Penicillium taxi TaxID=168475 RepID=UPI002545B1D5|nr:uncharacterized protein N7495_008226 [Penicillium taxi]KAJ5888185.1 hypothetical protein N7495_008226 [Penicillium taxi]